jgi:hypothetical protein
VLGNGFLLLEKTGLFLMAEIALIVGGQAASRTSTKQARDGTVLLVQ